VRLQRLAEGAGERHLHQIVAALVGDLEQAAVGLPGGLQGVRRDVAPEALEAAMLLASPSSSTKAP
jgi:hypothetical protein